MLDVYNAGCIARPQLNSTQLSSVKSIIVWALVCSSPVASSVVSLSVSVEEGGWRERCVEWKKVPPTGSCPLTPVKYFCWHVIMTPHTHVRTHASIHLQTHATALVCLCCVCSASLHGALSPVPACRRCVIKANLSCSNTMLTRFTLHWEPLLHNTKARPPPPSISLSLWECGLSVVTSLLGKSSDIVYTFCIN